MADGTRQATLATAVALQETADHATAGMPFLLLINKADLAASWEIEDEAIRQLEKKGWRILRTSAKTGAGVETAFFELRKAMLGR